MTLLTAVAVSEAIERVTGVRGLIKSPNDLLIGEQKICGILMEVRAEVDRLDYAVVGLGLNANIDVSGFPEEWRSTSLASQLGHDISRCELIARILEEVEEALEKMGSNEIYEEWRSRSVTLKRLVRITSPEGDCVGEVADLAEDGALLLQAGGKCKRVLAGDCIHLRALDREAEAL